MVGLIAADKGELYLGDQRLTHLQSINERIWDLVIFLKNPQYSDDLPLHKIYSRSLELQNLKKSEITDNLEELLQDLQITHLRNSWAVSLSGVRRRTEIARALASKPRFILLDEPFAGVDPIAVLDIQKIIAFLKNEEGEL